MAAPRSPADARRLLLAVSSRWGGDGVRAILASLVQVQHMAVEALFVEDLDLLHLAALPFTREVGRTSGISREIGTRSVEQALQAAARQMELDLRRLAEEHRFVCTFETRRGRYDAEVRRRADEVDVVIVPPRSGTPIAPARGPTRVIVLVDADSPSGERALHTAAALVRGDPTRLLLVLPDPARRPTAETLAWVRGRLPFPSVPLRVVVGSAAHPLPEETLARAGRHDVVVLPAIDSEGPDGTLDAALAHLPCTAVLVR